MTGCGLVTFRTRPRRAVGKGAGLRRPKGGGFVVGVQMGEGERRQG